MIASQSRCGHFRIALWSLCRRLYDRFAIALRFLLNPFANALQSLYDYFAITSQLRCGRFAIALQLFCCRFVIALQSFRNRFAIASLFILTYLNRTNQTIYHRRLHITIEGGHGQAAPLHAKR
jgi:hypothetical protein